jgi:hypothetical protein
MGQNAFIIKILTTPQCVKRCDNWAMIENLFKSKPLAI